MIRISLAHPQSDKSMKMPHVGSAAEPSVIDDFHSYKPPFVDDVPRFSHMFPYVPIFSDIFLCVSFVFPRSNYQTTTIYGLHPPFFGVIFNGAPTGRQAHPGGRRPRHVKQHHLEGFSTLEIPEIYGFQRDFKGR